MRTLAQSVVGFVRRHGLLRAGDRVGVAVSGGADSVALLRVLVELRAEIGIVLSVVHFNHKLRGAESDADEQFVRELAAVYGLEVHCESGDVAGCVAEKKLSVETAAREMRYDFFRRLLSGDLTKIATAHSLDDQAETVLLKVVRGAGTRGLAGIYPQLSVSSSQFSVSEWSGKSIVRPFLGTRRRELEEYLAELGQEWREDSSNRDLRHARNRVRHGILPRLERNLNPGVREALAETAEIARAEEEYWEREVARVLPLVCEAEASLNLERLAKLDLALRRRVVRAVVERVGVRLGFQAVSGVLDVASGEGTASLELTGGWVGSRHAGELRFERAEETEAADFEYRLTVPGRVEVPELGTWFEAVVVRGAGYNPEHLVDSVLTSGEGLLVRNWRAGDRFRAAHTKAAKKIKELLQERHVSGRERKLWPVVVSGGDVIWLRGFSGAMQLRVQDESAVVIREVEK